MRVAPEAVQDSQSEYLEGGFPPTHRLLREDGFGRVMNADNISNRIFKIFFASNDSGNARLGIIASKKILPRAVDRNRAKRLIREAFRKHKIKAAKLDVVVMLRPAYVHEISRQTESLAILLAQVKNKCAEF